jgi:hypothetical protein
MSRAAVITVALAMMGCASSPGVREDTPKNVSHLFEATTPSHILAREIATFRASLTSFSGKMEMEGIYAGSNRMGCERATVMLGKKKYAQHFLVCQNAVREINSVAPSLPKDRQLEKMRAAQVAASVQSGTTITRYHHGYEIQTEPRFIPGTPKCVRVEDRILYEDMLVDLVIHRVCS